MTIANIIAASKSLTFQQANELIENSGLELELIREMGCERLWRVHNNKDICFIANCYKSFVSGMSEVKAVFN